jgi:hypothetical protein
MMTTTQLDAKLDRLARMLPHWLENARHRAQFWPQFNALAMDILAQAEDRDRVHVLHRLDAMLLANGVLRKDDEGDERVPPCLR